MNKALFFSVYCCENDNATRELIKKYDRIAKASKL